MNSSRIAVGGELDDDAKSLVTGQLAKILDSPTFLKSRRRREILTHIVQLAIEDRRDAISEYSIAEAIYGKAGVFDPTQDSIVRVEVSRLRASLDAFYAREGYADPVLIGIPKGAYAPSFWIAPRARPSDETQAAPPDLTPPSPSSVPMWRSRRMLVLAAAFALIAGAAAVYLRSGTRGGPVAVTSMPGNARQPALSPDARQVAFVWDEDGAHNDIFVKPLRGWKITRLTSSPDRSVSPAWSPDGRSIAFLRRISEAEEVVYTVPATGGAEHLVTTLHTAVAGIAWAPDSLHLIVPDSPPATPLGLFLVSLATGERRQIVEFRSAFYPAISPDGRTLVYATDSEPGPRCLLYLLALDSGYLPAGKPQPLRTTAADGLATPSWTHDGRSILFTRRTANGPVLCRYTLATGQTQEVPEAGAVGYPSEVAAGVYLVAHASDHSFLARVMPSAERTISQAVTVLKTADEDFYPDLSPDGRKLAFVSARSGARSLWIANPDGSEAIMISSPGIRPEHTRWTPDSRGIYFTGSRRQVYRVYRAALTAGTKGLEAAPVDLDGADDRSPTLSHDGRYLYFSSNRSGAFQIWRAPISGGAAELMTKMPSLQAEESEDGQSLYFSSGGRIFRRSLRDGAVAPVAEPVRNDNFRVSARGVYFQTEVFPGGSAVRFQPFDPAVPSVLFSPGMVIEGFCPAPGQSWLYMGLHRIQSNLELLTLPGY